MVSFVSQKMIIIPILFVFFFAMTPSTSGAMFYFYTTELKFPPNFLGQLKLVYALATLLGILLFNKYLKQTPFVKVFFWSTILAFVTGLSQLLLITRKNLELGIPDKVFALCDSIIITVIAEINTLPILILACRLCPKNIEGTMYAFILSVSNFGHILSMQWGGLMTSQFGVSDTNFKNLWSLVLVSYLITLLPLLVLPCVDFSAAQVVTERHKSPINLSQEEENQFIPLEKPQETNIEKEQTYQNPNCSVSFEIKEKVIEDIQNKQFGK